MWVPSWWVASVRRWRRPRLGGKPHARSSGEINFSDNVRDRPHRILKKQGVEGSRVFGVG